MPFRAYVYILRLRLQFAARRSLANLLVEVDTVRQSLTAHQAA